MVDDLAKAQTLALEATSIATRRGWTHAPHVLSAHVALMWIGYQRVEHAQATRHLAESLGSLGPGTDPRLRRTVESCQLVIRMDDGGKPSPLLRD